MSPFTSRDYDHFDENMVCSVIVDGNLELVKGPIIHRHGGFGCPLARPDMEASQQVRHGDRNLRAAVIDTRLAWAGGRDDEGACILRRPES